MARPRKNPEEASIPADKRSRFVSLAEKRTTNALKSIRLVSNLSNKAHYEFTDGDIKKIVNALQAEVEVLRRRFSETPHKLAGGFKL